MPARICALAALLIALVAAPARATEFFAATSGDDIATFDTASLTLRDVVPLSGIGATEHVVALDVRPKTGGLYAVTRANLTMRVVRIDQATGAVSPVGAPFGVPVAPDGVGFDINPATDDAMIVTSGDQVFGIDIESGLLTTYAAPDPAGREFAALAYVAPWQAPTLAVVADSATNQLYLGNGSGTSLPFTDPLNVDIPRATSLDIDGNERLWLTHGTSVRSVTELGAADQLFVLPVTPRATAARWSGAVAFGASAFGASEGDGAAEVVIRRAAPTDSTAQVQWATVDATARAGQDYTPASGTVTFARGQSTATVSVPLTADAAVEGTERIGLRLTSVDGVLAGPAATILVADDDVAPAVAPIAPPPVIVAAPQADRDAPVLLTLPVSLKAARTLRLPFAVSERGPVTITLRLSAADARKLKLSRTLGTARLTARPGANQATVSLGAATLRKLRTRRRLAVTAELSARDAAGNTGRGTLKVSLRR